MGKKNKPNKEKKPIPMGDGKNNNKFLEDKDMQKAIKKPFSKMLFVDVISSFFFKLYFQFFNLDKNNAMHRTTPSIVIAWTTSASNASKPPESNHFIELLFKFINIGPGYQGVSSLITLILLYGVTGYYYNKWLSPYGGGLTYQTRVGLIFVDVSMNLALGMYYMDHRETLMGLIMLRCPIAISPLIFLLELVCIFLYYRYVKKK